MSLYKLINNEGIQIHQLFSDEVGIGIGVFSDIIEKLEVDGGIRIAAASENPIEGTIQYEDNYFQGYGPLGWVRLDAGIEYFVDGEGLNILTGNILVLELADETLSKSTSGIKVEPANISLSEFATPTASIDMGSKTIINLADPINEKDAATKGFVEKIVKRTGNKEAARLATTDDVNLTAAPDEVDEIFVQFDDRILVKNQFDARENGVYIVTAVGSGSDGVWTRSEDTDGTAGGEVYGGDNLFVTQGTQGAGTGWLVIGDGLRLPGVNNINWSKFTAGLSVMADAQDMYPVNDSNLIDAYDTGLILPGDVAYSSHIIITVNGKVEVISYGTLDGVFYFSINYGASSKTKLTLAPGDPLWFNPVAAGYKLEQTDLISFAYST